MSLAAPFVACRRSTALTSLASALERPQPFPVGPSQGLREPFRIDRPKLIERDEP
jgi:hypothetical protein